MVKNVRREKELSLLIRSAHDQKDYARLRNIFNQEHPLDIVKTIMIISRNERIKLYKVLNDEKLAAVIAYIDEDDAVKYLKEIGSSRSSAIITKMDLDDAADIINELDDDDEEEILHDLDKKVKQELVALASYDEDTAGSIMSSSFLRIPSGSDVKEAMKILIENSDSLEVIDPLFVCNGDVLVGIVDLKDLIIARSPMMIDEIMLINFPYTSSHDDINIATTLISNYDLYALPIIDDNKFIGIITVDDAAETIITRSNETYHRMALTSDEENQSIFKSILKRLPWLIVLLGLSIIISNTVGIFEGLISQVTVLVFFQTLILDMGGNVGTQSLAVAIRSLSQGALIKKKDVFKHLLKELKIGLLNGFLLSLLAFIVTYLFLIIKGTQDLNIALVSLAIAMSLYCSLLVSQLFGSLFPIMLTRLHVDPAVASGPFITTLNDILSILIYFGLCALLLGIAI